MAEVVVPATLDLLLAAKAYVTFTLQKHPSHAPILIQWYHGLWPDIMKATSPFWRGLATGVFRLAVGKQLAVVPRYGSPLVWLSFQEARFDSLQTDLAWEAPHLDILRSFIVRTKYPLAWGFLFDLAKGALGENGAGRQLSTVTPKTIGAMLQGHFGSLQPGGIIHYGMEAHVPTDAKEALVVLR
jgi:hypothetical protein